MKQTCEKQPKHCGARTGTGTEDNDMMRRRKALGEFSVVRVEDESRRRGGRLRYVWMHTWRRCSKILWYVGKFSHDFSLWKCWLSAHIKYIYIAQIQLSIVKITIIIINLFPSKKWRWLLLLLLKKSVSINLCANSILFSRLTHEIAHRWLHRTHAKANMHMCKHIRITIYIRSNTKWPYNICNNEFLLVVCSFYVRILHSIHNSNCCLLLSVRVLSGIYQGQITNAIRM